VALERHGVLLSLALTACSSSRASVDSHGDESGSTTSSTESDSSSTDTASSMNVTFVPPNDHEVVPSCDPFAQDCPDGEKCVPYSGHGGLWDAFKCVLITGEQTTGEPCTYGGTVEATDDCDQISGCWNVQDLEGEAVGICYAFCMGTLAAPGFAGYQLICALVTVSGAGTNVHALFVGASGTTALDASEYPPVPTALTACTRNRYCVPFASPAITCVVSVDANDSGANATSPTYGVTT
jgi:hypothetical protein